MSRDDIKVYAIAFMFGCGILALAVAIAEEASKNSWGTTNHTDKQATILYTPNGILIFPK